MQAGELREKIIIQSSTETRTGSGAVTNTWGTFATLWAAVEPMTGREFFQVDQLSAERTIKFVVRYKAGITAKMRISWNSRTFDIRSIINTKQRNRSMQLIAVERGV